MPPVQPAMSGAGGESAGRQVRRQQTPDGEATANRCGGLSPHGVRDCVSHTANAICLSGSTFKDKKIYFL